MIHHIEENQVNEEITKNNDKLVIMDFYADWCMPCQMLAPVLVELDKKYEDVEIFKVNIDEAQSVAVSYGISSIPTVIFFKNGEEVERKVGLDSLDSFVQVVEDLK